MRLKLNTIIAAVAAGAYATLLAGSAALAQSSPMTIRVGWAQTPGTSLRSSPNWPSGIPK